MIYSPPLAPDLATAGGMVCVGRDTVLFKATFAGFLGEEKGMKEIFASKEPAGTKPCFSCKAIIQCLDHAISRDSYLQEISLADPNKFDRCTDLEVFQMVEKLETTARTKLHKDVRLAEQMLGLNSNPTRYPFGRSLQNFRETSHWLASRFDAHFGRCGHYEH